MGKEEIEKKLDWLEDEENQKRLVEITKQLHQKMLSNILNWNAAKEYVKAILSNILD